MKHLFVMRHAKSSWKDHSLSDFERPLNKRGKKTAPKMGELMEKRGYVPHFIVSSPAARAVETYQLVSKGGRFNAQVHHQRAIYEASLNTLLTVVSEISESYDKVLMTGHNPGFEMLVQYFSGEYHRMPTAALAVIELPGKWSDVSAEDVQLLDYIVPKETFQI